ncbi:hypothetical protein [Paenibacillus sp. V4I7]|uniref:hypothetical protein n=1 Tax=Paenibacillus sp. V4I7 TaxID=3042307 RepID=UPI00277D9278|nr:hypothetical protein [Paenibacillus sp. V4I7]MDQ0899433.1 hypothetical protein [Paenibacillus sp. V4I7]
MKKRYLVLTVVLALSVGTGSYVLSFGNNSKEVSTLQNNTQTGHIHGKVQDYPFSESVKRATLIVKIKIKDKDHELDTPTVAKTIFNADIQEIYKDAKNSGKQSIKVMQHGNSKFSFNDNDLFKKDEVLVLFLREAEGFDNTYWLVGEETNFYKVLDNKVTKQAIMDVELKDVEIEIKKLNNKEVQVMDLEKFTKKIKDKVKEQNS